MEKSHDVTFQTFPPHTLPSPPPNNKMTTTITLPHLPPHALHLTLLLSLPPATAARLRAGLTSQDPAFEYAFLDARSLLSRTHVLAGAFQALRNALVGPKVRTRNVHSEIVFCLGGNNNVGGDWDLTSFFLPSFLLFSSNAGEGGVRKVDHRGV